MLHYENLQLYLRLGLKQKNKPRIRIESITMAKTIVEFNTLHRIEVERWKNVVKINEQVNAVYNKAMENLRNGIDVKLVSNEKDSIKWTSEPSCMSHKIFDNDLVAIGNV